MSAKSLVLSYDRPAPRYTSYPPATQFADSHDVSLRTRMLEQLTGQERLSLYVHIPFCSQLCYYCGCHTNITRKSERLVRYLVALEQEIRTIARHVTQGCVVGHVHFGGGSPTMLAPEQFIYLNKVLREVFSIADEAEIALEADPRQLSEDKISAYAKCGVNRISFGVQDIDAQVLASVNREQPFSLTQAAVRLCRDVDISQINFDLMYGLPYQQVETVEETMHMALTLSPSRIAFFGYAHVPWMKQHMKAMDLAALPDSDRRYDLFKAGSRILTQAGYQAIGIDHFVQKQDLMYDAWNRRTLRRNFQGYTTDAMDALIGFGASAISQFPGAYVQNKADTGSYETALAQGVLPPVRHIQVQPHDTMQAQIIESLMCYFEANLDEWSSRPREDFARAFRRLESMTESGVLAWRGNQLYVRQEPQLMARLVASAFDDYTPWPDEIDTIALLRHAKAV